MNRSSLWILAATALVLLAGAAGAALAHSDRDGGHPAHQGQAQDRRHHEHYDHDAPGNDHGNHGRAGHHHPGGADGHGHHHGDHHRMSFGHPGTAQDVDRTIRIVAGDTVFDRKLIEVSAGETIRFVIENKGELLHEFTIGTLQMQKAHQREMAKMTERGEITASAISGTSGHMHPNSVLIEPGKTKEIIWTFSRAGKLEFGCNIPGHYEAGMRGEFHFEPR